MKLEVNPAKAALTEAREAVQLLAAIGTEPEAMQMSGAAVRAWSRLLVYGNRVFTKLEQASKASASGRKWYDGVKALRKSDPLLEYLQHARNADEHTLTQIVHSQGAPLSVTVPRHLAGPGMPILELDPTGGGNHKPAHPDITVVKTGPARVILQPVRDRGVTYPVPKSYDGQDLADWDLPTFGALFVARLEAIIAQAE